MPGKIRIGASCNLHYAKSTKKCYYGIRLPRALISTIGTDHCDYTIKQKNSATEFTKTPGGIPGLETLLPLLATAGVAANRITWSRLVEVCSTNPARIFGLHSKGALAPGMDADVVIYDPRPAGVIRAGQLHNLAGYSPYEGMPVQGAVRDVFVRGRGWSATAHSFPRRGGGDL